MAYKKSPNAYPVSYRNEVSSGKGRMLERSTQTETILNRISTDVANANFQIDENIENKEELFQFLVYRPSLKMPTLAFWKSVVKESLLSEYAGIYIRRNEKGDIKDFELAQNVDFDNERRQFHFTLNDDHEHWYTENRDVKIVDHLIFKNPFFKNARYSDWIEEILNSQLTDLDLRKNYDQARYVVKQPGLNDVQKLAGVHEAEFSEIMASNVNGFIEVPENTEVQQLQQWSTSSDEAARNDLLNQLCSIWGISPAIFNNDFTEEQWLAYNKTMLMPLRRMIQDELNSKLVPMKNVIKGEKIVIREQTLDMVTSKDRAQIIDKLTYNGAVSPNDARELIGMDKLQNIEPMDLHFGNRNMAMLFDENGDVTPIAKGEQISHSDSVSHSTSRSDSTSHVEEEPQEGGDT